MKAYRISINLKLGLIVFAVLISLASLWYTSFLVERLRERETVLAQLWAEALAEIPKGADVMNPYRADFRLLERMLVSESGQGLSVDDQARLRQALAWAQSMPASGQPEFILNAFLEPNVFGIPTLVYDSTRSTFYSWLNIDVAHESFADLDSVEAAKLDAELQRIRAEMAGQYEPIQFVVDFGAASDQRLAQTLYYGESDMVRYLRWFPFVQLVFVGLFAFVAYVGFSYVRKSEQSSLWVGMAKEAAHQLGTPISSLMGWLEMLRMQDDSSGSLRQISEEIEADIQRLERVTSRFSDIGSLPKLDVQPLQPLLEETVEYMRRRLPRKGTLVRMTVSAESSLQAPLNAELFEWVIENLLKNAIDAMDTERGRIDVVATERGDLIQIDVSDTGRGIDRRQHKNIFRPGYSTKKRGWGLGLSLAKRIVEDYHGGQLALLYSRPGEGTAFRIRIPTGFEAP